MHPEGPSYLLSIVSPAFNEAENLPVLYERICMALDPLGIRWEWIIVDDHSEDETFAVIRGLAVGDSRVIGFRLARNSGSHVALTCAIHRARGDCVVVMAADLQDPPERLPDLLGAWRRKAQVVWAPRLRREGVKRGTIWLARLYYFLMRRFAGMCKMPDTGADYFLIDRLVVDAFRQFGERNSDVVVLISSLGFRHASIPCPKEMRIHGRSGWTLGKKIKVFVDSITAFSYLPIRMMSLLGFLVALAGFAYALVVVANALRGQPPEGWASLMVAVLVIGGIQMLMMGVLGEYLWRALDEARRRPLYVIEDETGPARSSEPDMLSERSRGPETSAASKE